MAGKKHKKLGLEPARTEAIKQICEHVAEPEAIWDELESKGIEATPGVVCQALNETESERNETHAAGRRATGHGGLSARDLELLSRLATRAGGVEQLMRILSAIENVSK